jgi:hypothetical protein
MFRVLDAAATAEAPKIYTGGVIPIRIGNDLSVPDLVIPRLDLGSAKTRAFAGIPDQAGG